MTCRISAWPTEVSANPRRVLADTDVPQGLPGSTTIHVRKGTLVDITPGSQRETDYGGPSNLQGVTTDLGSADTLSKDWLSN
jgi:hypothetical protein